MRQGDPLSYILFNAVLEEIFRRVNWENKGLKIDGKYLCNLRSADDVVLISTSMKELNKMCGEFVEESKEAGLDNNIEKTKLI